MILLIALLLLQAAPPEKSRSAVDGYLDDRWDRSSTTTASLLKELKLSKAADVEALLRAGRASYPAPPQPKGNLTAGLPLECDHVDYATTYFLYVPTSYDPRLPHALVVSGHGGNGAMTAEYAAQASMGGINPFWLIQAERYGFLLAAPLSERGWGAIGNSIVFTLISKLQREYNIDPDRICVTGHSMGGHLSWRSAIYLGDRWAAVGPMSGGYDFVESKEVYLLFNVPGYATYGAQEPYKINDFNNRMKTWTEEHRYPWYYIEKPGGHDIFPDEVSKMARFFVTSTRDLYADRVYARGGGADLQTAEKNERWKTEHTWQEGRPIPTSTYHWLRLRPLPEQTPAEKSLQEVFAINRGGNRIEMTSRNVRTLRLFLHPKMIDFAKPLIVTVNGKERFKGSIKADPAMMLELVREFDDRGRIFHAAIDLKIDDDGEVPVPGYDAP